MICIHSWKEYDVRQITICLLSISILDFTRVYLFAIQVICWGQRGSVNEVWCKIRYFIYIIICISYWLKSYTKPYVHFFSLKKILKEECLCSFKFDSSIITAAVMFVVKEPTATGAFSFETSTSTAVGPITRTGPITS